MSQSLLSSEYQSHGSPNAVVTAARNVQGSLEWDFASSAAANKRIQAEHFYSQDDNALLYPWIAKSALINPPGCVWFQKDQTDAIASLRDQLLIPGASEKDRAKLRQKLAIAQQKQKERKIALQQRSQIENLDWYRPNPTKSISKTFALKALHEYRIGNLQQAIFVLFNSASASQVEELCYEFPVCWTTSSAKADCINSLGRVLYLDSEGNPGTAPVQPSGFIYLPLRGPSGVWRSQSIDRFFIEFEQLGRCGIFTKNYRG